MGDSEENQTNAGSRPCRCVSAAMFPHRANKCKLFNTTNAGKAAVAAGAAQVSSVVASAGVGSRLSTSRNNADASPENKGKRQLTGMFFCSGELISVLSHFYIRNYCFTVLLLIMFGGVHVMYLFIISTFFDLFFVDLFLFWLFTTEEQHAVELKRLQDLRNIPNHRLFRSFLHMAGLNIAFIGAVSVVFLVTFGLCGHLVKIVFSTLGNALLRR